MPLLDPLSQVAYRLKHDRTIQDVIPDSEDFIPSVLFTVAWSLDGVSEEVLLGNELLKEDTQMEPDVQITPMGAEDGCRSYTLAMLDPDAPSRQDPKYGPFRHWLISGLKPPTPSQIISVAAVTPDLAESSPNPLSALATRTVITPYRAPNPGAETGTHRYVFLLFQEPEGGLKVAPGAPEYGNELEQRRNWPSVEFARQNGLTLVGANYFVLVA